MPQDLRYAVRGLARAPGFTFAAALTLALGIGASTSIFSVVDAVMLRPLPYPNSARLVMVWDQLLKIGVERLPLYAQIYQEYAEQNRIFEATGAFTQMDLSLEGKASRRWRSNVGVLPMLGASPVLGRGFTTEETQPGHDAVAILSHSLFTRRYGADRGIIGRSIRLDDSSYTIVGVMAPGFEFTTRADAVDVWIPLPVVPGSYATTLRMLARLRPGVSLEAAQAAMAGVASHLNETLRPHYGPNGEDPGFRAKVISLREELFGQFRAATLILLCAVAAVLLIACANVANLLLVRAVSREKEIAVRRALGASNARLMRQWMTEAAALALLGGVLGALASIWGVRLLTALSPTSLPAAAKLSVDARALAFTLIASLAACVFSGLAPSVAASRVNWTLRGSKPKRRAASTLVAVETALAVMLLIGAGLLLQSFAQLSRITLGFQPEHLLTMQIQLSTQRYPQAYRRAEFFSMLHDRLAALPGVISAGAVRRLPVVGIGTINSRSGNPFSIEGQAWNPNSAVPQIAHTQSADPDYFRTLRIPLIAGRVFTSSDTDRAPRVVVVNETLARGFFPRGDAIGRHILLGAPQPGAQWLTIVGIVGDIKTGAVDQDALPQFYTPHAQDPAPYMAVVIRTTADPLTMEQVAAASVHSVDPEVPVSNVISMDQRVARSIGEPKFETALVSFFAAAALFLAAIGIFGVVAHSTAQRTQEIGIRMALGANAPRVLRHVIFDGLRPVLIGVAAGLAGALALSRTLSSVLFHVKATDPVTFTLAPVVLTLVAVAACLSPARKATRIDPMAALRAE